MCRTVAGAGVDRGADAILLQHHVALHGRRGLVFPRLTILSTAAVAGLDLEDDDRIENDRACAFPDVQATKPSG